MSRVENAVTVPFYGVGVVAGWLVKMGRLIKAAVVEGFNKGMAIDA